MRPMMKLLPQLDMVAWAQPFARIEEGKTSAGMAHGMGPQVAIEQLVQMILPAARTNLPPNVSMKKSRKAVATQPSVE